MKNTKTLWFGIYLAIALVMFAASPEVMAEPNSLEDVFGATPSSDASMRTFGHVIGDHLSSPFSTLGAPDTLFGKLFLTLNAFVFLVGVIFASYGIGAGIVQTAHEGQVLGRRMSAIWMPIRMVTGIAGLIPFFGGFSLSQAVMMLASLLGIGLANYGWREVITNMDGFSGLTRPAIGTGIAGRSPIALSYSLFSSELCRAAYLDMISQGNVSASEQLYPHAGGNGILTVQAVMGYGKRINNFSTGTDDYCGRMEVSSTKPEYDPNTHRGTVSFGFTVNSVNYSGVSTAIKNGMHGASQTLAAANARLANDWYRAWKDARVAGAEPPPIEFHQIEANAAAFATSLGAAGKSQIPDSGVITNAAKDAMTQYGWFGAGAWYSTLAQGQAALTDAFQSIEYNIIDPTALMMDEKKSYPSDVADPMKAYLKQLETRLSNGGKASDNLKQVWDADWTNSSYTGNHSVGQFFVREMIEGAGSGSGGGGDFNPIIMLKNTGDYVMTAVQAIYFGPGIVDLMPGAAAAKKLKHLGGAITSYMEKKLDGKDGASAMGGSILDAMQLLMGAIFVCAAIMSLYIPFIPFIAWMGGLVQYVTIFFEGLVAAPIWAFAHLDADGEGMGQRAERGYIFLLNMLFRPFLMILGFVLAAALLVVLGTFQAVLFLPAMANVQGNSITGLASVVFLLGIFCILNITMIHGLFNLITLIPDQVLGWVGNMGGAHLGKEVEEKANQLFINLGRGVGGGLARPSSRLKGVVQEGAGGKDPLARGRGADQRGK